VLSDTTRIHHSTDVIGRARKSRALRGKEEVRCSSSRSCTPCLQMTLFYRPWVAALQFYCLGIAEEKKTSPLDSYAEVRVVCKHSSPVLGIR